MPINWRRIRNIVAIITGVIIIIGTIMTVYNYCNPPIEEEIINLLRSSSYEYRRNFVQIAMRVLNIHDIHTPKVVTDSLAVKVSSLAGIAHATLNIERYMKDHHIEYNDLYGDRTSLDYAFAKAKVFISEAVAQRKSFIENKEIIENSLKDHYELAKKFDKEKIKYNHLLYGQYHRYIAFSYIDLDKQGLYEDIMSECNKAFKKFEDAFAAHKRYMPSDVSWVAPLNSKGLLYENLFVIYGESRFLDLAKKTSNRAIGQTQAPNIKSSWHEVVAYYNYAEKCLWDYNIIAAKKYLDYCKQWFDKKGRLPQRGQDEYDLYMIVSAMDKVCDMFRLHRYQNPNSFKTDKDKIFSDISESKLDSLEYSGHLIFMMKAILNAQEAFVISSNPSRGNEILRNLESFIDANSGEWEKSISSRPSVLVKIIQISLENRGNSYPEIFETVKNINDENN